MGKYNFYDYKGKELPEDINAPVIKMLIEKLNCPEAADFIKQFQKNKVCGSIQIFDKIQPKHIKLTANFGMIEGYDLVETKDTEKFMVSASKHIKNSNLDMKKKEQVKNGR